MSTKPENSKSCKHTLRSTIIAAIITAIIYFIAARLSLLLAVGNTNVTSVWPPSGIALAVILLWGYRMGPAVLIGAFIANILVLQGPGVTPAHYIGASFTTAAGNMLEGIIGAYFIKRFSSRDNPFETMKDLFVFILFGSIIGTMVSATIGVSSYCFVSGGWAFASQLWFTWWLGDAAGVLIVSPAIILARMARPRLPAKMRLLEAIAVFAVLTASSVIILWNNYHLEYVMIPPLLWISFRFGRFYSAMAVLLVSGIAVASTIFGGAQISEKSLFYLQTYVGVISIITLCLSVITYERGEVGKARLALRIEERERAERNLSESERKYRDLVESANSVILRWMPDGTVTFFNAYAQKFFGFTEVEITGKNILGTIVPVVESSGRDLSLLIEDIVRNPEAHTFNENENVTKDGKKVWIAWTNRAIFDSSGSLVEVLSVGNDITERKNMEESLRKTLDELARAKDRAESADRLKSAFLATMSHELRTPLNSIIGFTGIILQGLAGPLNDEQKKQMNMVRDSAQHLLSLINDVLDISKIEAGQLTVYSEPFNLRMVIEKAVAALMPMAGKKGISLIANIGNEIGDAVNDRRRVEQILLNLLSNAVKFTEQGSVSLFADIISEGPARVPSAYVKIADTGIGIEPDQIKELFQPFHQIDTGLTRKSEGTGLGLAICRRLADLMGCQITVESEWGHGSTFSFIIPLKENNHGKNDTAY